MNKKLYVLRYNYVNIKYEKLLNNLEVYKSRVIFPINYMEKIGNLLLFTKRYIQDFCNIKKQLIVLSNFQVTKKL